MEKRNLLKNPCGEGQMEFWEITENGGNEWRVEEMPGDCGSAFCDEAVKTFFVTSFERCLKKQEVDLLAEDYSPEELDAQPAIEVEDWYSGRTDCGCAYELSVCLLDENHEVIAEFKPSEVTLDPDCDDCSWKKVAHTFTDYGPGVRYISFEHGGQDTKYWEGWFGVRPGSPQYGGVKVGVWQCPGNAEAPRVDKLVERILHCSCQSCSREPSQEGALFNIYPPEAAPEPPQPETAARHPDFELPHTHSHTLPPGEG